MTATAPASHPSGISLMSQLDGLFVLELSSSPIRGAEAELVTIQFKFNVWTVQHRSCFSCVIFAITTFTLTARP